LPISLEEFWISHSWRTEALKVKAATREKNASTFKPVLDETL
jgi:hypothetical protein